VRLAKFFGTGEAFWLGMQADLDTYHTKKWLRRELEQIERINLCDASAA
jgi:plasmid maintenance system antidote protein VapI